MVRKVKARQKSGVNGNSQGARARKLEFNHAMIYSVDLARGLEFYRDMLGFQVVDEYPGVYVRLRSPGSNTTIALHLVDRGMRMDPSWEGLRLYFEVKKLDAVCKELFDKGVVFLQPPKDMPWGWRHAYLRDPDGHEISLYWAGNKRLKKTAIRDEAL